MELLKVAEEKKQLEVSDLTDNQKEINDLIQSNVTSEGMTITWFKGTQSTFVEVTEVRFIEQDLLASINEITKVKKMESKKLGGVQKLILHF